MFSLAPFTMRGLGKDLGWAERTVLMSEAAFGGVAADDERAFASDPARRHSIYSSHHSLSSATVFRLNESPGDGLGP